MDQCVQLLEEYDTQVLAASVRNTQQLRECAMVGANICTVPAPVLQSMVVHPKTIEGMKKFDKDKVAEYDTL